MLFRRMRDVAGMAVGGAILLATGAAARHGVGETEAHLFKAANRLPDRAFRAIWIPMQYGTFGTVPAAAALALTRRRPHLALSLVAAGTAAWFLAKAVKPVVSRGRPASALAGVNLRGTEEGDQGFPSGHAAVSAALTVVVAPYLPKRSRLLAASLAGFVPFARLYVGAHLPLDVIGGSALGVAIGCGVNLALGVPGNRSRADRARGALVW